MIKKVNKNLVKVTSTILVGAMLLTGCGAGSDTVAKVNGDAISVEAYSKDYNVIKRNYEAQFGPDFLEQEGPDGVSMEKVLKENVLDKLIVEQIIMQKAEKEKFMATDEEVNKEVTGFKEMVGGQEGFDNFLKTNDMDEEYFKSGIKKEITVEKYREKFLKDLKLEDKDLKEYYEANKEKYETIKASHILVEKEEDAKAISKELKEGGDFAELSKKSIEPDAAEREGDLGYFGRGQMVPEFEEAAFKLKVDEISDPVKTEHGYHVIKVTDKKDSFDKVKEEVKGDLENEKFGENLEKLKEDAKVKTYMENVEKVGHEEGKDQPKEDAKDQEQPTQEPKVEVEDEKDVEVKEEPKDKEETIDKETQDQKEEVKEDKK